MDEKEVNKATEETAEQTVETSPETEEISDSEKKKKKLRKLESELDKAKKELAKTAEQYQELNDRYVRMLAEYDNFRRRSQKEHESIYADAYSDALKEILPVLDNLERASQYNEAESVLKGVQMTLKQMTDMLAKLGITEIETKTFDPAYHNAVMHIEDDKYGEGEIVNVLQKGYMKGDKIIRYAMVTVAN